MKTIFSIIALVILIACNNKESNPTLVGKWKPVEVKLNQMSEEEKKDALEHSSLEFTKDSNYVSIRKDGKQEGKYTFDHDTNAFTTISTEGSTDKFTLSWDEDLLRLTHEEGYIVLKRQ